MSDRPDISDDDALAAEYVLSLLDPQERQAFEQRLTAEPDLRAAVSFWEAELSTLAEELPEASPPAALRARVLDAVAPSAPQRRWGWGWFAFPSLLMAALVAFFFVLPALRGPGFDPTLHASLASEDGTLVIEAGYSPTGSLFKVIREAGGAAPGRDLELWVIGPDAEAPVSLGVIPADMETTFEISPEIAALIDGGVLAVSDEPEGGSPTGAPTGDILATGAFFDV